MKRRILIAFVMGMCLFTITGCGKKESQTVSDNISNVNTQIQGLDEINAKLEEERANSGDDEVTSNVEAVVDDSVSDGDVSDNSVSEDNVSDNSVSDSSADNSKQEPVNSGTNVDDYLSNSALDNPLVISNMSGRDLKEVYVSFSSCGINNLEITQGKKLKDGNKISYAFADMQSFRDADNIILSVSAVNKKGEDIDFGDIKIIDVTNMNVVLTNNNGEYTMYIR